jgi:hypothetical protein
MRILHAVQYRTDGTFTYTITVGTAVTETVTGKWEIERVEFFKDKAIGNGYQCSMVVQWKLEGKPDRRIDLMVAENEKSIVHTLIDTKDSGGVFLRQ